MCDLQLENLPNEIVIAGEVLPIQPEHHISFVCTKRLVPLIDSKEREETKQEFVKAFLEFESNYNMTEYQLTNEFFVVETDDRKTVVVKCVVPYLEELFQRLSTKLSYDFPVQIPHITLYARNNTGIGLISNEELARIAKPVDLPELSGLRKVSD